MEHDYKINYDLGNGVQTFSFIVSLVAGVTQTFIHEAIELRTLNNGNTMQELATYTFKILVTTIGIVISLLLVQRLLINEFSG